MSLGRGAAEIQMIAILEGISSAPHQDPDCVHMYNIIPTMYAVGGKRRHQSSSLIEQNLFVLCS
ncbi:hypothetical protein ACJX0J_016149, partial [Zea mays]